MSFSDWYHADAVELDESKISDVLGFKCCKCRRIKSPVCPYSDQKHKMQEATKTRSRASKKGRSGKKDGSGNISVVKEFEAANPNFPIGNGLKQENDPLLFSLSSTELITEPNIADVEKSAVSGPGPQKLQVRRQIKHEGEGDDFMGVKLSQADLLAQNGTSNLTGVEKASSPLEYDTAACLDSNLLNDCGTENFEFMEFEPHTYFSVTELLQADDTQFEGADLSGDFSGYLESSFTMNGVPEECRAVSLDDKPEPATSSHGSAYFCSQCSHMDPPPDLSCVTCGLWIHSHCSPWVDPPPGLEGWMCGNCRKWK